MGKLFTILVVDDEPINVQVLTAALRGTYGIITALSGNDAICQIKEHHPDLILLDVMMPDLDGFEVCSSIKQDPAFADIPVIFLTAMDSIEAELRGLGLGGIDYMTKPINIDLLRVRVRNHLELKERNDIIKGQRDLLERQKAELEAALERVKRLEGVIPICMHCKSIRDDNSSWQQLEKYICDHSDAHFSHGICPRCIKEHYPDIADEFESTDQNAS